MKKVVIIGSGGSGKSTLAEKLGKILKLPVYHLDQLFWQPGWVETPRAEWIALQTRLCSQQAWIIDGNYGSTQALRLKACDTVIFLDFPRAVCILRVIKRYILNYGQTRPDMGPDCKEKLDLKFLKWLWDYPKTQRPGILQNLERFKAEKNIVILRSNRDVNAFIGQHK